MVWMVWPGTAELMLSILNVSLVSGVLVLATVSGGEAVESGTGAGSVEVGGGLLEELSGDPSGSSLARPVAGDAGGEELLS